MAKKAKRAQKPQVYRFMVSLVGSEPLIWRTFLVHDFVELGELHMLIQMSMGWEARHLYEFQIGGKFYASTEHAEEMDVENAEGVLLRDVLGEERKFTYIYDFGDSWEHQIEITDALEHDPRMTYPVCTGGENACPPEDCGGIYGYTVTKSDLKGSGKRRDNFHKDKILESMGIEPVGPKDYPGKLYDRGHMAPAADFKRSQAATDATFVMSNMTPQTANLNRRAWENLEARVRTWICGEEKLTIVSGPVLKAGLKRLDKGIAIPERFFKVVYDETPPLKSIAFVYSQSDDGDPYKERIADTEEIEKETSLRLPKQITDYPQTKDVSLWKQGMSISSIVRDLDGKRIQSRMKKSWSYNVIKATIGRFERGIYEKLDSDKNSKNTKRRNKGVKS